MSEIEKAIAILADKAICEFCEDCGNDEVCIKCKTVTPVTAEELRMFYKVAVQALQEKLERENPKPLGLEELERIDDSFVWIEFEDFRGMASISGKRLRCDICKVILEKENVSIYDIFTKRYATTKTDYGKTWIAYRYEPKGVEHIGEATNMIEGE